MCVLVVAIVAVALSDVVVVVLAAAVVDDGGRANVPERNPATNPWPCECHQRHIVPWMPDEDDDDEGRFFHRRHIVPTHLLRVDAVVETVYCC